MKSIVVRAGSACPIIKLATIALAITLTLTACGEHGLEDIFGLGSSSSEDEEYYSSSSLRQNSSNSSQLGTSSNSNLQQSSSSSQLGDSSSSSLQQSSSSSQIGDSSSSSLQQSSSSSQIGNSSDGSYTEKGNSIANYKTKQIGTQTWMAENLDYNVAGSRCYNNNPANCAIYGRLYDWVTAMALDASCKSSSCASQVNAKHRGICPSGWHIPSNADWNVLMKFVNPSCKDNSHCAEAGAKLKAANGWNEDGGTDNFGFAALPGGGYSEGNFYGIGYYGNLWSASEVGRDKAYSMSMSYNYTLVSWLDYTKDFSRSVRCVKD
ncbi:MAG: fibrobacter succinogenes major paralogous domain-containing protein [Fibromonadaceae bacterium]|jgi:uncharacterized protein (TIGR02145 family)|nr:fibrobacter succinogenes major paralogous domain-containing protein [Fibromonadaceae bacterium]